MMLDTVVMRIIIIFIDLSSKLLSLLPLSLLLLYLRLHGFIYLFKDWLKESEKKKKVGVASLPESKQNLIYFFFL